MPDRTQHIIDSIDGALGDWSVGPDAMRWTPETGTRVGWIGIGQSTTDVVTVEIVPDVDAWQAALARARESILCADTAFVALRSVLWSVRLHGQRALSRRVTRRKQRRRW